MEGGRRVIQTGITDFKEIRESNLIYVDKSELISDILARRAETFLFTRPRRFGKTLNLSMLDCFFNLRYKGNHWFDGLKVMDDPHAVSVMNAFPVIRLDMKNLRIDSEETFISDLRLNISKLYQSFDYLKDSKVQTPENIEVYMRGRSKMMDDSEMCDSLNLLLHMLNVHHGIKPIVLIDEYDGPLNNAFGKDSYEGILGFLRHFYSNTLKTNVDMRFAVVTGVMQIAKESIFSGLNNLEVNNIFSVECDERFGFTPSEVESLCEEYGDPDAFETAKEWYDGYRFGDAEIYNPWSVIKFIRANFKADSYWAGTSGNDIIDTLVDHADSETYGHLLSMANGDEVRMSIDPLITTNDLIDPKPYVICSVLAVSGYLNAVPEGDRYALSVPNREMMSVFSTMMDRTIHSDAHDAFGNLFGGLENGDEGRVRDGMQRILDKNIPFILLTRESDYQLIIGSAAMGRLGRYSIALEAKSGGGRADIIMTPNSPGYPTIILELKRSKSFLPRSLKASANDAIAQIKRKHYCRQMKGRVLLWGICFRSKEFETAFEEMTV